jgi:nucleoside-diphosphate-sugar epimerase
MTTFPPGTKVLVTGATGFTGSVLTRKLVQAGAEVHAIVRESSNLKPFDGLNIIWHKGRIFDEATISAAAKDVQYVFHLAAAYREAKYTDEIYRLVHVTSTRLLARALTGSNLKLKNKPELSIKVRFDPGFKRFVHVSTVGVHGHIASPPADENYPFNPGDIYQATKAEAELWLRQFAAENKLPFTVIRPAAIYGPGDRRLLKFFRMAASRFLILPGTKRGLYHLVHVEDLTDAMLIAATHPAALNEVFICGNPECMTLEQIAAVVADELGTKFTVIRPPAWPFFIAADICEKICRKIGVEPPLHRRRLAFFTKDRSFDTRKLREKLGINMRYTNEEGLRETTRWYCAQGWLGKKGQRLKAEG